jgi:hypothetical protein
MGKDTLKAPGVLREDQFGAVNLHAMPCHAMHSHCEVWYRA